MLRIVALLIVVAATSALILFAIVGNTRDTKVEHWLGERFAELANFYLVPELTYETLDYQAPYSVTIDGARLVAEGSFTLAEIGRLELTLAERPQRGKPIRIARVRLVDPSINLLRTEDGFQGLDPIVHSRDQRDGEIAAGTAPKTLLSDILRLEHATIENGSVHFDEGDDSPPMLWDQINFAMADERSQEDGAIWHDVSASLDRLPVSSLDVQARVNLDEQMAQIESATFAVDLSQEGQQVLPPQVQQMLARHNARGTLTLEMSGEVAFSDWTQSALSVALSANDALVMLGEVQLPLEDLSASLRLREQRLELEQLSAQALGGEIQATSWLDFAQPNFPARLDWEVRGLDLRDTIAVAMEAGSAEGEPAPPGPPLPVEMQPAAEGVDEGDNGDANEPKAAPRTPVKYAGLVTGAGFADYAARTGPASLAGEGTLQVREGRLINLPMLSSLTDVVTGNRAGDSHVFKDTADLEFTLTEDAIKLENYHIVSTLVAARGEGRIFYDGRLALTANAGPLEKVQDTLGAVGDLFASLTDLLVTYDIGGTVQEPTVTVRPLGIGTNPEAE